MIGQFRFATPSPANAVTVRLVWLGSEPAATVHAPEAVLRMARKAQYLVLPSDETIILPLALGYGVSLALLTAHALCLSGDISVWREEWGTLNRSN
jgi:hypothetical protein